MIRFSSKISFLLFYCLPLPLHSCGMNELRHVYLLGKLPNRCGLNESLLGGICHLTC
ncbi:hypothetical protein Peur_037930 [Populus x canadensis]